MLIFLFLFCKKRLFLTIYGVWQPPKKGPKVINLNDVPGSLFGIQMQIKFMENLALL